MTTLPYPVRYGSEVLTSSAKQIPGWVRRHTGSFCLLILGALLLTACASINSPPDRVSLWKIQNGEAVVYLLGSVHALTPKEYPLPTSMEKAFTEADQTVFEVDLGLTSDEEISRLVRQLAFYKSPMSLQSELSDDTLILLKDHLAEKAIEFDSVKRMKPWFLSLTLALNELKSLKYEADLGVDQYFQQKARSQGKPIIQLESIAGQFQLLASDPPDIQELALRAGIEDSSRVEQQINELINAWRQGDADEMWRIAIGNSEYPALDSQVEKLIDNRNVQMTRKIAEYLKSKQTTLVVVGALHIGGEKGILNLMSANYVIEQMGSE